jgi:hypothetical protein
LPSGVINPNPVMTGDHSIEPGILCPIPLPFEIDDFAAPDNLLAQLEISDDRVLGDWIVHDIVNRKTRVGQNAVEFAANNDQLIGSRARGEFAKPAAAEDRSKPAHQLSGLSSGLGDGGGE